MAKSKRYVRNRTGQEVFVKGHGVIAADFEGDLMSSDDMKVHDPVRHLVGAHVLADVQRPEPNKTTNQKEGGS